MTTLIEARGLTVRAGDTVLVDGADFILGAGSRTGIIGESGSGKTITALAIMGLLPDGLTVVEPPIVFFVDPPVTYTGISVRATAYAAGKPTDQRYARIRQGVQIQGPSFRCPHQLRRRHPTSPDDVVHHPPALIKQAGTFQPVLNVQAAIGSRHTHVLTD